MTSNLALNLADFAGKTPDQGTVLTPENTDLTASRADLSSMTIEGVNGGQGETVTFWDPENGADEDSVPGSEISESGGLYNWFAASAGIVQRMPYWSQTTLCVLMVGNFLQGIMKNL